MAVPRAAVEAKQAGIRATQKGDYSEAAVNFAEACRLDPKLSSACYFQGRSLYYANRFSEALAPLRKSIDAGESDARARSTMAECFEALGKNAEAERAYRKSIANDSDALYKVRYASFLFRQGRANEAVAPLEQALTAKPKDFDANLEMGRVRFELGNWDEALRCLNAALRIRPVSTQAHLLAAKVCQRLGRRAEAEEHLKAARVPEP